MTSFRDTYVMQHGDICIRRLKENLFEVSEWRGTLEKGSWHDQRPQSLTEINRFVRCHPFLGKNSEWEYYRPAGK
jgi:hypothetical protein